MIYLFNKNKDVVNQLEIKIGFYVGGENFFVPTVFVWTVIIAINKGIYTLDISDITFPTGAYFCELKIDGVYRKVVGMVVVR